MNEMYLSIKEGTETKAKLLIEDLKMKMSKNQNLLIGSHISILLLTIKM